MGPEVTRSGILDMQVCVPKEWTDDQIVRFANSSNPCGASNGWLIRKQGDEYLNGDPERQKCTDREGFIHVMLDC